MVMLSRLLPSLGLASFAIVCIAVFYLTGHELRIGMLHADALYLPTLFKDMLHDGGHVKDWYLTPAPYFFPDFAIYLLGYGLGTDNYAQVLLFAVLQCGLLLYGLQALARQIVPATALPCATLGLVLLIGLALTNQEPFVFLLSNASHFGAFVSAVLCMAAWLRFEGTGAPRALWMACILAFLTTLSDSLFLLQTVLPLTCVGVARTLLERDYFAGRRLRLALPWMVLGAAILGYLAYGLVVTNPMRFGAQMDLRHIAAKLQDLDAIALHLWNVLPLVALCWIALLGLAAACAVRLVRRRTPPFGLGRPLAWLLVFWLLSSAGALTLSLLVTNVVISIRYFIPLACWPVLLAPLVAAHMLRERAAVFVLTATLACCIAIGMATALQWRAHALELVHYGDGADCIDRTLAARGLRHGIAQYWDAKTVQSFSHLGITLAQYNDQLDEIPWITSKRYFRPAYDFAVIGPPWPSPNNIPADKLEAINGKPAAQVVCGSYTLLLYGRDGMRVHAGH